VIEALRARGLWRSLLAVGAACLIVLLSMLVPSQPSVAIGAGILLLAAGLVLTAPSLLLAAVFATAFAYWRVGPASINMSMGDAVTLLALAAALPYVPWQSRTLRTILAGLAFYLALLAVSVLGTLTQAAAIEWLHRGVLFGGAILIGAAVAHRGYVAVALKAVVYAATIVAAVAIFDTVTQGLQPAYPLGMHKNAAGPLLAMVLVILIIAPWRTQIRPATVRHLRILIIAGLLATQSRGAALALVAVVAIYAMRHRSARQRAPLFFLAATLLLIVLSVVTLQDQQQNNPKFNGVTLRVNTIDDALNNVWANHPYIGGGLKYFKSAGTQAGGAEQIFVAELSEAGLIGLIALLGLLGNTLRVLRPRRDVIGETAFLVFLLMFLYSLTAIFWIAGTLTLPMLLVGLAASEEEAGARPSAKDALSNTGA
jgi:hypothetical protein